MSSLKNLLKYFKKLDGEKAKEKFNLNTKQTSMLKPHFDYISQGSIRLLSISLKKIDTTELCEELNLLKNLCVKLNFNEILLCIASVHVVMEDIFQELDKPDIVTLQIGKKEFNLKYLAHVPLCILLEAATKLKASSEDDPNRRHYRRLILMAAAGAIPVEYLDEQPDFVYRSMHFPSFGLKICEKEELKSTEMPELLYRVMLENARKEPFSEASLRVILWDPLISEFFREEGAPWKICSELNLNSILKLDCERKADFSIMSTTFNNPTFVVEVGKEEFFKGSSHKDFAKLNSILSTSCIHLAMKLKDAGIDPSFARTFGLLIGGDKVQMAVGYPVITESTNEKGVREIYTCVSMHEHWFLDFGSVKKVTECLEICRRDGIMEAITKKLPKSLTSDELKKVLKEELKGVDLAVDEVKDVADEANVVVNEVQDGTGEDASDEKDGAVDTSNADNDTVNTDNDEVNADNDVEMGNTVDTADVPAPPAQLAEIIEKTLNKKEYFKLSEFMEIVKKYIRGLVKLKFDTEKKSDMDYELKPLSLAFIPGATSGTASNTPFGNQLANISNENLIEVSRNLEDRFKSKKTLSELEIYRKHLLDYCIFPKLYEYHKYSSGAQFTFEKMLPLVGTGQIGFFSKNCFCPGVVRARTVDELMLDAATFAIHSLYGLHVLHEKIGFVHGDISPSNIMFSPLDGIWKLNDFGASMAVEESLQKPRKSGTRNYVAPETEKTGIFTKSSDVYGLGRVLWNTFHYQIIFLLELNEDSWTEVTESVYDKFFETTRGMIEENPIKRLSVLQAMRQFTELIEEYKYVDEYEDFPIYGSNSIMLNVKCVLETAEEESNLASASDSSQVPMTLIASENHL